MRTTVRTIVTAALLLSCCLSLFSQQVAKTIPTSSSPDGLIGFLEFKPKDYGSQKHPLIIFLHGIGERGNGTSQINSVAANAIPRYCAAGATMKFTVGGVTSSFVVLSPQLSVQYGYWPTYYVQEMINYAKANLQIDPNRIYVTGLSLGGGGVWRYSTEVINNNYGVDAGIAAIAPVCGTQEEVDANVCSTIGASHLPVWAFHSMDDGTVGVGATQHAQILLNNCGVSPAPKFTYYQNGDHWGAWVNAYDTGHITTTVSGGGSFTANPNIYEWFLSNSRSAVAPVVNTVPVANAGTAQTITLPSTTVTLSGSGSGTNGATISSYAWTKTSGPSSGSISSASSASTYATGLVQGTYIFTLTVTDNHGLTASSTVTITVNTATLAAPNLVPVSNAGTNQTLTLPTSSTTLNGSASKDADGSIVGYEWTQMSGATVNYSNRLAAVTTISGLTTAGSYNFVLRVTDNVGAIAFSSVVITVNAAASAPAPAPAGNGQPIGYIKQSISSIAACADASSAGRIAVYSSSIANGSILYTDAAHTQVMNGGWNWFSYTSTLGGAVTQSFAVYPNGGIFVLTPCAGAPATTPTTPTTPTAPTTPTTGNLLGYVKMSSGGSIQACGDASSTGRTAVYGSSLADGSFLYTDAAMTQPLNGGWNWYAITPTLGSATTYAFAVYPIGKTFYTRSCANGGARTAIPEVSDEAASASLKHLRDSAAAVAVSSVSIGLKNEKLAIYPNPVHVSATIQLNSLEEGMKTINLYDAAGVLKAKYTWQTIKGNNSFSLKDVSGMANGLYIIDIRDKNGKSVGSLKFLKI